MKQRDLSEIPGIQRRAKPKPLEEYAVSAANRDEAMFLAYRSGGYTLQQIAHHWGVHYSTVNRMVKRVAKEKTPYLSIGYVD